MKQIESAHRPSNAAVSNAVTRCPVSDDSFQFVFENSLDAMVIADDQGRYLEVNQPACALFGYSRRQMLRMSVGDLVTAQSPGAQERYKEYLRTGRESGEFTFVRADKQVRTA